MASFVRFVAAVDCLLEGGFVGALNPQQIALDLGFATLTSSTSQYNHEGDITSENTGFYAQNGWLAFYYNYPRPMASAVRSYGDKALTQELRLTSKSGDRFDYVLGAYYQDQERYATQISRLVGFKRWWDTVAPGLEDLILMLVPESPDDELRAKVEEKLPTSALVRLELDIADWRELDVNMARITAFIRPIVASAPMST